MRIKRNLKLFSKIIIIFILLVLVGCGGNNPTDPANQPPIVTLSADTTSGNTPLTVNFTASASDTDGTIVSFDWDFEGIGNYITTTITNIASHTYNTSGTYNAKVKVIDNGGAAETASVVIAVTTASPPVKTIFFNTSGAPVNNSVYLEKLSTNGDEITLDIKVKGGTNVYGAALEMTYDSAKISYIFSSKGDYLGADIDYFSNLYNNQQGLLLIGIGKTGDVPGVNGDGSLCTVVFKALAAQTGTPIQLNSTNSCLKSPTSDIPGTSWFGGSLSYQ
ncbi:MAG: PKD domain-containing protein [bacterium]